MSTFYREQLYRSAEVMARLRELPVAVCGAGALGANITESLARAGVARLRVIDRDHVEERNLSTQPFQSSDTGAPKAKILAHALYRAVRAEVEPCIAELSTDNVEKLLGPSALVVDAFDNSGSRQAVSDYCRDRGVACLHAGLAGDYAEVIWNEIYRVPSAARDDVCDYPLARNLVMLTVAVACEAIMAYAATGERHSYTITLRDLTIKPFDLGWL